MSRVRVQPVLLHWAMARSGTDVASLSRKKDLKKLSDWLSGKASPTLRQLEAFARATHTGVGYFFLDAPPVESLPIPDFRVMGSRGIEHASTNLLDTIYLCQQRQNWYREYALMNGEPEVAFVGSAELSDDVVEVAADMRRTLEFDMESRRDIGSWTDALRQFIRLAEQAGVLVMVSGVVGSNSHRPLDPEEFRGFALADALAPLVFINQKDTKAAQMFTLAHELAHLWLGKSGISDVDVAVVPGRRVERWCNAVAAELLAPAEIVARQLQEGEPLAEAAARLARYFKVSTLVVLRRLKDVGFASEREFTAAYRAELERLRHLKPKGSGGGDFYNTLGARVGKRFATAVITSTLEGQTPFTEAFDILGVRKTATLFQEAERLGVV
ncbi:MAG: hypothetical protein KatS3mg105_5169 [Gemmatales bacterium]|nr:MAG: hypothetical protein KatS3mg105_4958 [Gemmatales bacterium]GIW83362.1 MAG: hypothetical protein KatS3mg105_5169 [Gemmatales bacterium]